MSSSSASFPVSLSHASSTMVSRKPHYLILMQDVNCGLVLRRSWAGGRSCRRRFSSLTVRLLPFRLLLPSMPNSLSPF